MNYVKWGVIAVFALIFALVVAWLGSGVWHQIQYVKVLWHS